ncbi:MAG: DNA-3-methyladenine glycosylase [Candidatus Nomurabacteria bacterium]|nr:DNA-3-methyladenine glycosylase [Candidatus Nomurabacteria bacterium]
MAKSLLGKFLVRKIGEKEIALQINEVELYEGLEDLASHGRKRTPRSEVMYGEGGHIYAYLTYGMHEMLNIVVDEKDHPAAVLIRGAGNIVGPGRLTKYLQINRDLNTLPLSKKYGLWIEDRGIVIDEKKIIATPRIGIDYSGPIWSKKKLRFLLK